MSEHRDGHPSADIAAVEAAFLEARDALDRADLTRATDLDADVGTLDAEAAALVGPVRAALAELASRPEDLGPEDRRAVLAMDESLAAPGDASVLVAPAPPPGGCADARAWAAALAEGGEVLRARVHACFASVATGLRVGGESLGRLQVLARLGREPDALARRRLFLALEPLWRVVDGDGITSSPYRVIIREAADASATVLSRVSANAQALGVELGAVEMWATTILAAWRAAVVEPTRRSGEAPVEPWDWWWRAGAAQRALSGALSLDTVLNTNRRVYAALGADMDALNIRLDLTPRPSRPPIPVAFTTFGGRPRRLPDGRWSPGRPVVLATLTEGGLTEFEELVHETGHAVHIAGIRTRPAFASWPDADAYAEALADLVALELWEPAWQRRWIPGGTTVPEILSIRCRHAEVALDAAWTLFEIKQHRDPARLPNDTWTEITSIWLGIARHPEWSWWAIRGQLVQDPGGMSDYAIGAVLAAALRDAIRDAIGGAADGDAAWYPWVSEHLFRFGASLPSSEQLAGVLGGPPSADALLAQIERGGRVR
jgi:hypothetical protein